MLYLTKDRMDQVEYRYNHYTSTGIMLTTLPIPLIFAYWAPPKLLASTILSQLPTITSSLVIAFVSLLLYYLFATSVTLFRYQRVLIVKDIGFQVTSNSILLPRSFQISSKFVPLSLIKDFIITESFKGLRVVFCLSVLLNNYESTSERKLIPIFPGSGLRLKEYKEIRKNLRRFLKE